MDFKRTKILGVKYQINVDPRVDTEYLAKDAIDKRTMVRPQS